MLIRKIIPRGKKGGVVTNVVLGIGTLIVAVIITFIIISTLSDANLLEGGRDTTTVTNETEAWLNISGYTLAGAGNLDEIVSGTFTILTIWSNTEGHPDLYNFTIPLANATTTAVGVTSNATEVFNASVYDNVSLTYSYTNFTTEELSEQRLTGNFTQGIDEVSKKIPTILLIVAVVFLFGALVLLVQQSKRMGIGSGSSL